MTMHVIREIPRANRRLDSWKEIAAFCGRDERTAKRWEKEKALPVHRLRESSGARVFAFTDDLARWMNSPDSSNPEGAHKRKDLAKGPEASGNTASLPSARSGGRWIAVTGVAALAGVGLGLTIAYSHKTSPAMIQGTTVSGTSTATTRLPRVTGAANVDPEAQELYLKGRYHWDKRTPDDLNKAIDFFTQAIVRDPNYAPAYVGLANCYSLLREFTAMPSEEAFPRALAAAKKAVELDDSSAEAHNSLAFVSFYWNWDAAGAEREFRRAIKLDPNYVTAHHWYATFLIVLGRFPEALREIDHAQQLDPASTPILADKALILYHQGEKYQAIPLLKQIEATQPAFFSTHQYLSHIYLDGQDYPNYLEEAKKSAVLSHDERELAIVQEAEKGFRSGGGPEMLQIILRMQKKFFAEGAMPAFFVASTSARLGNKAEALRYLKISSQRHEPAFLSIRLDEPMFPLHNDPAFRELVTRAGLPPLT